MIELLCRKKAVREFLNLYSTNLWIQIIPLITEIGVLHLIRNFNIIKLNVDDLKNILNDIKVKKSGLKYTEEEKNIDSSRPGIHNDKKIHHNIKNNFEKKSKKKFFARKPSGEWRKGDDIRFKENLNFEKLKRIYSSNSDLENNSESDQQNNNIYPLWWGGDCENYRGFEGYKKYDSSPENNKNLTLSKENYKSYNRNTTEIYVSSGDCSKSNSRSRTKRINVKAPIDPNDDGLYKNLKYIESKIKSQVIYDKQIHDSSKRDNANNTHTEWKYNKNVENSNKKTNATATTLNNNEKNKKKINYLISYDKNFKPELIQEKSKEMKEYSRNESRKESRNNSRNEISNDHYNKNPLPTKETANFNVEESLKYNKKKYNDSKSNNSCIVNEISSKKDLEQEILSSYAPSERTKNIFQRQYQNDSIDKNSQKKSEFNESKI